jgi:ATP-dependent helicase/nuclease subunit A
MSKTKTSPKSSGPTPQQAAALETRAVSIALSAGAGCGKTYVLTRRYLAHVDPDDPQIRAAADQGRKSELAQLPQLIAITFTERAAREMRERIRSETLKRLQTADEASAPYWLSLFRSLDTARISTFHAFCASLLRSHAVEAGLDPSFQILEENTARTLGSEATEDTLRAALSTNEPGILALASLYGIEGLRSRAQALASEMRGHDAAAWLAQSPAEIAAAWKQRYETTFLAQVHRDLRAADWLQKLEAVMPGLMQRNGKFASVGVQLQQLLGDLEPTLKAGKDAFSIWEQFRELAMPGKVKKLLDKEDYEKFQPVFEKVRDKLKDLRAKYALDTTNDAAAAESGLALLRLAQEVGQAYEERKRLENGLDFTDLQLRARDLLLDPAHEEMLTRLRRNLRLLLVDECQDTDPVQVEILRALAGSPDSNKLFIVGDYKQSIYRFRGADPAVFVELRSETPAAGRLPLSQNFRSQPGVISFVNTLFAASLHTAEEPYEPLIAHRPAAHAGPCVEFLWAPASTDENTEGHRATEARWIARRLRQLLDSGENLIGNKDGTARPLRLGDIAILFRSLPNVQLYEEALREHGIPYYLVGGHAFYAQQEIYDLLNLLSAVQSSADEIALAGALRSPIFGLADETLFWLARDNGSLAGAFAPEAKWPTTLEKEQLQRAQQAARILAELRQLKDRLPITDLIRNVLEKTGYDAALAAEFLGERKLANLEKLIEMARVFDRSTTLGLADFIVQLREFVVNEPKESLAATHPENTDVVKLMSIHKSKGLEFQLVVVPDLERRPNSDLTPVAFDPELGPLVDAGPGGAGVSSGLMMYRTAQTRAAESESTRLFYVATTRAADYLILSSSMKDIAEPSQAWTRLLAERFDLQSGACLAAVPGIPAPQIRATTIEPPEPAKIVLPRGKKWRDILGDLPSVSADLEQLEQETHRLQAVPPNRQARRRFSISRLTSELKALDAETTLPAEELTGPTLPGAAAFGLAGEWTETAANSSADAAQLGILTHAVLSKLSLTHCRKLQPSLLRHWIEDSADRLNVIDSGVREVARAMLEQFHQAPRCRELAAARSIHTEVEFLLPRLTTQQTTHPTTGEPLYFQGFLDLLYQNAAGEWWIVDYKTNMVPGAAAAYRQLVESYRPQLSIYAMAVEEARGAPPAGMMLHFLRTGQEEIMPWNSAARAGMETWLEQSLSAVLK